MDGGIERVDVLDLLRLTLDHGAPGQYGAADWPAQAHRRRQRPLMRLDDHIVAFAKRDHGVRRAARATGGLGDGIEHGLDVSGRRGNDTQDLGACSLLLE